MRSVEFKRLLAAASVFFLVSYAFLSVMTGAPLQADSIGFIALTLTILLGILLAIVDEYLPTSPEVAELQQSMQEATTRVTRLLEGDESGPVVSPTESEDQAKRKHETSTSTSD